jgi:hypothetical protein
MSLHLTSFTTEENTLDPDIALKSHFSRPQTAMQPIDALVAATTKTYR